MSAFSDSYVLRVLLAQRPSDPFKAARRSRWLRAPLIDPYRHELHYKRGPRPQWREKHACEAGPEISI
jgi:hypothetical protein